MRDSCCFTQSLDFVLETKILVKMKIETRRKIYFLWENIDKHRFLFFFPMKIKVVDL